ncbi:AGE family epimerase/isomerase [Paenibacillus sp. GCM10027626]|uniref:AGE family epimerase/isomerase n=1 Tax=Paenibacillus sp. GCM10027626 TaxID=3273411 RepID=UPI00363A6C74
MRNEELDFMIHDRSVQQQLAAGYRRYLLEDVMPFWELRTKDPRFVGFLTDFDREGQLTSTDKNMWLHGRQVWMFSALYNYVEKRAEWLNLAIWGREFIKRYGDAGGGKWHYILTRQGEVIQGPVSIFADMFVLLGLSEFAIAANTTEDFANIIETFGHIERKVLAGELKNVAPMSWNPKLKKHGIYMICLNMIAAVRKVLGEERVAPLRDHCLDAIMETFVKKDSLLLYEAVDLAGNVEDSAEGMLINPGHTFESMWFCMEEGIRAGKPAIVQLAAQVVCKMLERSWDEQYGGIYYMLDARGGKPSFQDWVPGRELQSNEKVWWTHAEALYAVLLASTATGNERLGAKFVQLSDWCWNRFHDKVYGEWYYVLHREGLPRLTNKGGFQKAGFHLPRALLKIHLLLKHGIAKDQPWFQTL